MNKQLAKHIEGLEVALLQPEVRRSAKRISELLADDFIEFGTEVPSYGNLGSSISTIFSLHGFFS